PAPAASPSCRRREDPPLATALGAARTGRAQSQPTGCFAIRLARCRSPITPPAPGLWRFPVRTEYGTVDLQGRYRTGGVCETHAHRLDHAPGNLAGCDAT